MVMTKPVDKQVAEEEFTSKVDGIAGRVNQLSEEVGSLRSNLLDIFYDEALAEAQQSDSAGYEPVDRVAEWLTGICNLLDEAEGRLNSFVENGGV